MSGHSTGAVGICDAFGKAMFPSPELAHRRRKILKIARGDGLEVYRCPHCRLWHLGHGHDERRKKLKQERKKGSRKSWRRELGL